MSEIIRKKNLPHEDNRGFTGDVVASTGSHRLLPTENRGLTGDVIAESEDVVGKEDVLFLNPSQHAAHNPGLTGANEPVSQAENPALRPENLKERRS